MATNLGMVGIKSIFGAYLQAHSDNGEMHASNAKRNEEETWFLIETDKSEHLYSIYNWSNGKFMSKGTNGCAPAVSTVLGAREKWRLISGEPYVSNAVCFQSILDNTFLGTNSPNHDSPCGGEVAAQGDLGPVASEDWVGWWVMEAADKPNEGKDFWNTVGGTIGGAFDKIANQITPADVGALLKALASAPAMAAIQRRLRLFQVNRETENEAQNTEGCANQTFDNVSAERFACLVKKAATAGIKISGYEGEISQGGFTVRWKFDATGRTLNVQCLSAPIFVSCGFINGKLHDLVDECPA